jgi:hypothetical protein
MAGGRIRRPEPDSEPDPAAGPGPGTGNPHESHIPKKRYEENNLKTQSRAATPRCAGTNLEGRRLLGRGRVFELDNDGE